MFVSLRTAKISGPLHDLCTGRQIGIASYGSSNCTNPTPSVLARVSDNLQFINEIISKTTPSEPQSLHAHPTASMPDIRPGPATIDIERFTRQIKL